MPLLLAAALALQGCTPLLSTAIVSAPNRGNPFAGRTYDLATYTSGADRRMWVDVGPPHARLLVQVVEPPPTYPVPRGTILVVHGFRNSSTWMMANARHFAAAGYRAVAVDLRGHGRSSGDWVTYGIQESADLVQVIDALEQWGLIHGGIGVYGISLGGATSIQLAGRDPRVGAVVAVAPFAHMREVTPQYYRTVLPFPGRWTSEARLHEAIELAGAVAGFNPDDADTTAAIRRTTAPVLLLHGTDDWLVPPEHSLALHQANPRSQLILLPDLGHVSIWLDSDGVVAEQSVAWFDRWLGGM